MSQLNPNLIVEEGILTTSPHSAIQQVGCDCSTSEEIILPSKGFKNILLNESVELPNEVYMMLYQRSSYSRKGVFVTSGIYDAGFCGRVGCSIYNLSDEEIIIPANTRICQAVFYTADAASSYNGSYQGDYSSGESVL